MNPLLPFTQLAPLAKDGRGEQRPEQHPRVLISRDMEDAITIAVASQLLALVTRISRGLRQELEALIKVQQP
jgi:hypothetical protein